MVHVTVHPGPLSLARDLRLERERERERERGGGRRRRQNKRSDDR
jgi:hypothetical protein